MEFTVIKRHVETVFTSLCQKKFYLKDSWKTLPIKSENRLRCKSVNCKTFWINLCFN